MADLSPALSIAIGLNPEAHPLGDAAESYDAQLVSALRLGSEDAYETLIQRFQNPVYNLIYRLLDNPDEAADVLQEVFLKVFRKIGSFRAQSSLKTWIYRIAVNEAYNHRRSFNRHRRQEVGLESADEAGVALQEVLADQCRSPFEFASDRETQARVEEALTQINPSFRAAVVLRDLEEFSYEEIADILQVQIGTVKSRILRGREALRKILIEEKRLSPAWVGSPVPAGRGTP